MGEFKIEDEDLYELLDIKPQSTTSDIKRAYRKKALQCHPDKNPDNPDAAKLFHQLTKILEVLSDEAARKAYDKVLKGKKEAALRHRELDSKRKKLKEDLEAREKHAGRSASSKTSAQKLKEQIERLRKEGSQLVQEEMEYMKKELREEKSKANDSWESNQFRIKLKWKSSKTDETNGGYTQEQLHRFLSKYGDVTALVMSLKKKGSAMVEFKTRRAAEMAMDLEKGLADNPLDLQWVNGPPQGPAAQSSTIRASDYESVIITKMRQAEERKRLIEQMMAEDNIK